MTVSRHMAAVALLLVSGLFGAPHAVAAPLPLPRPVRAATHPVATAPIQVALTFDDLPSHGPFVTGIGPARAHGLILQALKEHDVPPTYGFINGNVLEDRPELRATLKAWVAAGNYLGNHTYSHYSLGAVPPAVYEADIDRNEPLLRSLMPNDEWRWRVFRYPYLREGLVPGVRETIRSHLLRRGYRIAEVTIDFGDWAWNDPFDRCLERGDTRALLALKQSYLKQAVAALRWSVATADDVLKRPIPHVMLLHVGAFDAVMLDALLTRFEQEGVKFITLDEALADPIYSGDTREAGGKLLEQLITTQRLPHTATMPFPEDLLDALCR